MNTKKVKNTHFEMLFQRARNKNEERWRKKIEKYQREGKSKRKAEKRTEKKLKAEDVKEVLRMYRKHITNTFHLEHGTIQKRVMNDIYDSMDDGIGLEQAIQTAVRKNRC